MARLRALFGLGFKIITPDWDSDVVQAINNESGADNRSLYVVLARLLATYLGGCPDDVSGMITLCRRPAWLFQNVDCAIEDARLVRRVGTRAVRR